MSESNRPAQPAQPGSDLNATTGPRVGYPDGWLWGLPDYNDPLWMTARVGVAAGVSETGSVTPPPGELGDSPPVAHLLRAHRLGRARAKWGYVVDDALSFPDDGGFDWERVA